ncbi:MAG: LamG-like jellyroll fold domain-containing protein, partial [Armatimonadota bacterium]
ETVIRREGWYTGADGTRFCQFITYTWFHAGSASVRHDHSLVVGFDTHEHTIRDIRLAVPVAGAVVSSDLSHDDGEQPLSFTADALPVRIVQSALDACTVTDASGAPVEGAGSGGRVSATAANGGGVGIAIRDFAEQYPMELEVTGEAVVAHLWPAHDAPVLDFAPSAQMGEDYPGDRVFWRDFYRGGLDSWTQAFGLAKTHNLQLSFLSDGDSRSRTLAELEAFDEPVLAFADPEYACDTWAFGRVEADDPEQFPRVEAVLDAIMHRKLYLRNRLGNYGWINFGDVNYQLANALSPEEINFVHWRHWAQMFYGGPNIFYLNFMRSGDRDAWDFARVNTRHITDIDICHLDDDGELDFQFEKFKGGRYGGNGGICHYAANIYIIGCDSHLRFMMWDYYLNGTPRTWEVMHEFMDHLASLRHEGYNQIYRHRMTGGSVRFFAEAYEATWNPEYLSIAHQFADILYKAQEELGQTRYDDVYMNEGKVKYYQMTGDERMRDLFLNDMRILSEAKDAHVFADTRSTTLWGLAHAYWFTGDRSLLPFAAWQWEVAKSRVPTEGAAHEIGAVGWTFEHAYESTLGNQLPTWAALMADVEALPGPSGPTGSGNGPIYLREDEDGEFTVKLQVDLYQRVPGLGAAPFSNWEQWAQRLPEEDRPALVVTAPDGAEVARFDLLGDREQEAAMYIGPEGTRDVVQFTVPADGQTGTYALAPNNEYVRVNMKLAETSLSKHVHQTGDSWVYGAVQSFLVPAGTEGFAVEVKAIIMRTNVAVTVRNAEGEEVASAAWNVGSDCRHDPERLELNAGAPARDETWSISFLAPMATYLRFEGVPPFVAASGDALFVPERTVEMPAIPAPEGDAPSRVESPLEGGGEALALPPRVGVALASPDGTPLMNEAEGTVEMWVRDARQPTDLRNRALVRSGDLHIYRRINVGTYIYMGPGHQTGMLLPPGRWTHLAATWRPSEDAGKTEVALYVDGVRVETTYNRHIDAEDGWPGTELRIPADHAGVYIDELRVSSVARYEANFDRPEAPFAPDENTLILSHFDDDGALVQGTEVEWETR